MGWKVVRAGQLALLYKLAAVMIEFGALLAMTLIEEGGRNFREIVGFAAGIIFKAELMIFPYFYVSAGIVFAVALVSQFRPSWTGTSAGITFLAYWYLIMSSWHIDWMTWAFGIVQTALLSAVAGWLAWKVRRRLVRLL